MIYKIEFKRSAAKTLKSLPQRDIKKISKKIDSLGESPTPRDAKKIKGEDDLYRVRVGDYRILYTFKSSVLTVLVVRIGHRKNVYSDL